MAALLRAMRTLGEKYPVVRGMATYSVLWPTSNLVQQSLDKSREGYDLAESLRYLVLGTFATAPTVYVWVRAASRVVRGTTLRRAVLKVGWSVWHLQAGECVPGLETAAEWKDVHVSEVRVCIAVFDVARAKMMPRSWPSWGKRKRKLGRYQSEISKILLLTTYCLFHFAADGAISREYDAQIHLFQAGLEQILFAPVGQTQFYLGITLLEGRPWAECKKELKEKLLPTWKVGLFFWPVVQTINFAYVMEKNRVVVVSIASFMWTMFLSYMHHVDQTALPTFLQKHSDADFVKKMPVDGTLPVDSHTHWEGSSDDVL